MTNPTNDELNRRVAEIEGWTFGAVFWHHPDEQIQEAWMLRASPPPYATDWTWCGKLIDKYGIQDLYQPQRPTLEEAILFKYRASIKIGVYGEADTPQRAICLSVIASEDK